MGGALRGGRGDLQKCDYPIQGLIQIVKLPNPRADPDCKITQSPIPLGC